MQLLLRSYFARSKRLQLLQILSVAILCNVHLSASKEIECVRSRMKCVNTNLKGVWYAQEFSSPVCAKNQRMCRIFKTPCELARQQCKNTDWIETKMELCDLLKVGESGDCHCHQVDNCSHGANVCGRRKLACKIFKDDCELKLTQCHDDSEWQTTDPMFCCAFEKDEEDACFVNAMKPTCATRDNKICRHFISNCNMTKENDNTSIEWKERSLRYCRCIKPGFTGGCNCSR